MLGLRGVMPSLHARLCGLRTRTLLADPNPRKSHADNYDSRLLSACMRAFLLATSPLQRARLMLPGGVLSDVEFPVTSKYVASPTSNRSCDFCRRVSRASVWKGASAWFHSTLAFSISNPAEPISSANSTSYYSRHRLVLLAVAGPSLTTRLG